MLQLSALLKQADSSKRKLTLTRLASAPVPFTVLSLTGNPCNEDYLAVCGLKVRGRGEFKWIIVCVCVCFLPVEVAVFLVVSFRLHHFLL